MSKVLDEFEIWGYEDVRFNRWHMNLLTKTEKFCKQLTGIRIKLFKHLKGVIWGTQ